MNDEMNDEMVMFTFRLPKSELEALREAAKAAGLPMSEYLRKAAAQGTFPMPRTQQAQVGYSIATPGLQFGEFIDWTTGTVYDLRIEVSQTP